MRRLFLAAALAASLAAREAGSEPMRLTDLAGAPVALTPRSGETLVLHFWATWCPSCARELDDLAHAASACSGARVRVVAVNAGEGAEVVRPVATRVGASLEWLLDPRGRAFRHLGGRELPLHRIWSEREARVLTGPRDAAWWRTTLADLGCERRAEPPAAQP